MISEFKGCMTARYNRRYFYSLAETLHDNYVKRRYVRHIVKRQVKYFMSFKGKQTRLIRGVDY